MMKTIRSVILPEVAQNTNVPPTPEQTEKQREESKKRAYTRLLTEVIYFYKGRSKRAAIEKMKEIIVTGTYYNDFKAIGAAFIICAMIEYSHHNYNDACEYLVQLVFFSIIVNYKSEM